MQGRRNTYIKGPSWSHLFCKFQFTDILFSKIMILLAQLLYASILLIVIFILFSGKSQYKKRRWKLYKTSMLPSKVMLYLFWLASPLMDSSIWIHWLYKYLFMNGIFVLWLSLKMEDIVSIQFLWVFANAVKHKSIITTMFQDKKSKQLSLNKIVSAKQLILTHRAYHCKIFSDVPAHA